MTLFIQYLFQDTRFFFMVALIVIFSTCLHEYFHAQTACFLGDTTAADRGHLTLNPLKQMGVMSLVMFLFIGIVWGAVPVDESRLRGRWSPLFVSLAGVAANLLLFLISWFLLGFLSLHFPGPEILRHPLPQFVFYMGVFNFVLLTFNLVPAPGLDGWRVLTFFFPKIYEMRSEIAKGIMLFLFLLAFLFIKYLFFFGETLMAGSVLLFRILGKLLGVQ